MIYPRTLVVSNNSFSKTGSNGRTLASFFFDWPKESVAQFCISTDEPDYEVCNNYYLVTDKSAFDGFIRFRKANRCSIDDNLNSKGNTHIITKRTINKSPITAIIRNIIWQPKRWKSSEFTEWVQQFNPEVVLLMNSDSVFMLKVAMDLSQERKLPLVMFNTEGFYFFKKPYFRSNAFEIIFFKLYQSYYHKWFSKTMNRVAFAIYANSKLQSDYSQEFEGESTVLYTGSSIKPVYNYSFNAQKPIFSYIGNLAYSRIDALIEIAEVLHSINPIYSLDVYGRFNEEIKEKAKKCSSLRLKGFINYDQVKNIIEQSDVLFHAETQEEQWKEALRYGFSTKIADSICSGKCFVIYSSSDVAGADYIIKTGAGWFASSKDELRRIIVNIINDENARSTVLKNARKTALRYHQTQHNSEIFKQILLDVVSK